MRQLWVSLRMGDTTKWHNQMARMMWNIVTNHHNLSYTSVHYVQTYPAGSNMLNINTRSVFKTPSRPFIGIPMMDGIGSCTHGGISLWTMVDQAPLPIGILYHSRCICHENFPKMHSNHIIYIYIYTNVYIYIHMYI